SCCPVLGGTCVAVDRRNNHLYIGMNMKSNAVSPDFEPAVIAMPDEGDLKWWSRLYHEITPDGVLSVSIPDQYVDALAIDYSQPVSTGVIVVGARAHGNNTENFWEGNTVASNPDAYGFQNQFTGTNGNIHESWLGKLQLETGTFVGSTFVAELTNNTGSLGTPHADPNLDGWPDPNSGWPDVNTTRIAKNALRVTADGSVCMAGVGRRTITTANAYQKMVKPENGGNSCWNSFVRVYKNDLTVPLYSSLVVGQWDTITQAGGDNTELFGICKTHYGIIGVGRQKVDENNIALGNDLPVINVPSWGSTSPENESAILVYYVAENLENEDDSPISFIENTIEALPQLTAFPNPADNEIRISFTHLNPGSELEIHNSTGQVIHYFPHKNNNGSIAVDVSNYAPGLYFILAGNTALRFVIE
ncbi:MAG: T9SS type A sorting domain-containing protein, partial [Flavobacteriales bacterium]